MQLHEDRHVVFSGYRIPHPLENKMLVMISTDGAKGPCAAMEHCLEDLKLEFHSLRDQFNGQAASIRQ
jgi:DNA-directed RNA polymerase II subunit RPB11